MQRTSLRVVLALSLFISPLFVSFVIIALRSNTHSFIHPSRPCGVEQVTNPSLIPSGSLVADVVHRLEDHRHAASRTSHCGTSIPSTVKSPPQGFLRPLVVPFPSGRLQNTPFRPSRTSFHHFGMDAHELARWTRFAAKGGIGRCTAIVDCIAQEMGEDLMFLKASPVHPSPCVEQRLSSPRTVSWSTFGTDGWKWCWRSETSWLLTGDNSRTGWEYWGEHDQL